jgi:hypothetical protein
MVKKKVSQFFLIKAPIMIKNKKIKSLPIERYKEFNAQDVKSL